MKHHYSIRALALCAALAISTLTVQAQTGPDTIRPNTDRMADTTPNRDHDRPSYSWVGLLGLLGLAGLMRKRSEDRLHTQAQVRHT